MQVKRKHAENLRVTFTLGQNDCSELFVGTQPHGQLLDFVGSAGVDPVSEIKTIELLSLQLDGHLRKTTVAQVDVVATVSKADRASRCFDTQH
jgi:hypothetical protein